MDAFIGKLQSHLFTLLLDPNPDIVDKAVAGTIKEVEPLMPEKGFFGGSERLTLAEVSRSSNDAALIPSRSSLARSPSASSPSPKVVSTRLPSSQPSNYRHQSSHAGRVRSLPTRALPVALTPRMSSRRLGFVFKT